MLSTRPLHRTSLLLAISRGPVLLASFSLSLLAVSVWMLVVATASICVSTPMFTSLAQIGAKRSSNLPALNSDGHGKTESSLIPGSPTSMLLLRMASLFLTVRLLPILPSASLLCITCRHVSVDRPLFRSCWTS